MWVDFSGARVIAGREEHVTAEALGGTSHAELQSLYEKLPVNTASDAVLRGADTLPADEGCAMIYCVLQHLLKNNNRLRAMRPAEEKQFINQRASAFQLYRLVLQAQPAIQRVQAALTKLGALRESISTDGIRSEVHDGLTAAFEWSAIFLSDTPRSRAPLPVGDIKIRRRSRMTATP